MKIKLFNEKTLQKARDSFKSFYNGKMDWAVVLGSGLSGITKTLEVMKEIPFEQVAKVPAPSVHGHGGKFVIAKLGQKTVCIVQGRVHCYEGYSAFQTSIATGMLGLSGCEKIIFTNAAGGVNESFAPGDIMTITDHLNFLGDNPLRGTSHFIDMCSAYDREIEDEIAKKFDLKQGVYAAMAGPSYETPAEIHYLKTIGADAVGMSTVPSVIMANYMGMKVVGLSLITNMGAGITGEALSHDEVLETGKVAGEKMIKVLKYTMQNH